MDHKDDNWYGKNLGFIRIEEYAALVKKQLKSGDAKLIQGVRDNFNACTEYLKYPKDLRTSERDEHARISREIIKRIANSLGLKI